MADQATNEVAELLGVNGFTDDSLDEVCITAAEDKIDAPCIAHQEMMCHWDLIIDLLGGTTRMRAAGEKWLPKEPREIDGGYKRRLARSFLYEAFKASTGRLASRPFSKPINIKGTAPAKAGVLIKDVDQKGTTITSFAKTVLESGVRFGLVHIFVDYSYVPPQPTLEKERQLKPRPIVQKIDAPDLIGWQTDIFNGTERLTEIRFKETAVIKVGTWGQEKKERIRVYRRGDSGGTWELWEKELTKDPQTGTETIKWVMINAGGMSLKEIPLVTLYLKRTDFMKAEPPMEDLAWLNLENWQSASDQRNLLRFARAGILFMKGFEDDEGKNVKAGPTAITRTQNVNADMKIVEHSGAAIGAGRQDLLDNVEKMEVSGLQPLIQRAVGVSATSKAVDEAKTHSQLEGWVLDLITAMMEMMKVACLWTKETLAEDFLIDIYNDFAISTKTRDSILALLELRAMGDVTRRTLFDELKRYGLFSDNFDPDKEIESLKKEPPPPIQGRTQRLGGLGGGIRDPLAAANSENAPSTQSDGAGRATNVQ